MMNDDRFDDLLQEAAREHNSAPDTPRAEMWAAIAAARGAKSAGPVATPAKEATAPEVRVIPLFTRHRRAIGWVAGLAATLLVGVMIGRGTVPPNDAATGRVPVVAQASPTTTATRAADAANAADNPLGPSTGPVIPSPIGPSGMGSSNPASVAFPPNGARGSRVPAGASNGDQTGPTREPLAARDGASAAALPYRMAAMQHLVTTEALLISLRSDVRGGRSDTTIAVWAGDLLGTTRMLIDSPAGRDPQLKQLLEDLELVLAQISRLPGAHGEAADLGLIDDAVRRREIMTRLRALSPNT